MRTRWRSWCGPGAYSIVQAAAPDSDLLYFAFVNYTTLGYGDITPVREWRLIGPLTAMNGVLLFGWSAAILFEVLRKTLDHLGMTRGGWRQVTPEPMDAIRRGAIYPEKDHRRERHRQRPKGNDRDPKCDLVDMPSR